ncbi:MAG: HAD family hydrolase, partial [Cloacibacillus sp.]|nr:HAD family hydrolase [Cloacibacillus sp.]
MGVADEIRPESAETVAELRRLGIKGVYMLTGDRNDTATAVARELKLDGYKAELLPGDKVDALKDICHGDTKKTI